MLCFVKAQHKSTPPGQHQQYCHVQAALQARSGRRWHQFTLPLQLRACMAGLVCAAPSTCNMKHSAGVSCENAHSLQSLAHSAPPTRGRRQPAHHTYHMPRVCLCAVSAPLICCSIPQVLMDTVLHPPEAGPALSLYESGTNTIFLFVAVCVAYGMGSCAVGQTPRLPLVAEAADTQIRGDGPSGF